MAETPPQIFVTNIGVITNACLPLFKVPAGFGGITLIEAQETFYTVGTAQLYLIDAGTVGTATGADGTLATGGGTAHTAKTPIAFAMTTPYLEEGHYLAVKESNIGSTVTISEIAITYVWGK